MANSVRENILQNVETVLGTVVSPTYETDLKQVSRKLELATEIGQYPAVFIVVNGEAKTTDDTPIGVTSVVMSLTLEVWLSGESAQEPTDLSNAIRDIETALMADRTRGGYAIDTKLTGNSTFASEVLVTAGADITLDIEYRHSVNDPTSTTPAVG